MPPGAVYVGRLTKWVNPFHVTKDRSAQACVDLYARAIGLMQLGHPVFSLEWALIIVRDLPELRGKDLCCWCKPGAPCHADALLELANPGP
jgi:hypothetical protein